MVKPQAVWLAAERERASLKQQLVQCTEQLQAAATQHDAALAAARAAAHNDAQAHIAAKTEELQHEYAGKHAVPSVEAFAEGLKEPQRREGLRLLANLLAPGWLLAAKAAAAEVRVCLVLFGSMLAIAQCACTLRGVSLSGCF